jgi:hypothetical protein
MTPLSRHAMPLWATALMLVALTARAEDRAKIDATTILGNRELPKVLYIVPWKKPVPGDLNGRPLVSVVDEALAPLDRDVFKRQVQYQAQEVAHQQAIQKAAQAAAPPAVPPADPPAAAPPAPAASAP